MIPDSCDASQGYWNPTQAGFFCAYKNGVVDFHVTGPNSPIICDGAFNNNCGAAVKSVEFQEHQMFNWDYGPSYQGPYNARDTAYFSQAVEASDNFVEYSLTFQNKGITRAGPIEIPTFYFNNNFRHYFFKTSNSSQIKEVSIPLRLTAVDSFRVPDNNVSLDWISFENTSGVANDVYTLAWFYSNEFTQDVMQSGYSVSESQFYKSIKFTNEPIFNAVQNKKYNLKYVVFPFKYSEVIDSRFGRMSVADVIVKLKYEYLNSTTAPTAPPTPTMPVEPRFLKFSSAEAAQSLWPVSALIDGDKRSSYSSPLMPTAQNNAQQKIAAYLPVQSTVNKLKITARMYNGMALGFPKSYNLYVTSPENTSWINLGTFSNQPDTSVTVTLTFAPLKTHGVHIVPLELGKDNEGNYYFQLSELEIYGD